MLVLNHKELALSIAGKSVLHLNSLGKDSAVCLEWLANYAHPSRIVSVYFKFLASHPDDDIYLQYQKRRYPHVTFIEHNNPAELSELSEGTYQSPLDVMAEFNKWEHTDFDFWKMAEEIRDSENLDYICVGHSKYESVTRASNFYKKGILQGRKIFPIGMMTKADIIGLIASTGVKIHSTYKLSQSTLDHPSWYKMRAAFITNPAYEKKVFALYPLLRLDKYRYEKLFKK